jgi:para-nitrobenzyl esterase
VTANPEEILRRGKAAKVPLIIGTTSQDLPVTYPPSRENPLSYFGVYADKASALYNPSGMQPSKILTTIAIDMTMQEPARFVARQMVVAGNSVWLYRFGYVAESLRPKVTGADHASEQPYLFSTLDAHYGKAVTALDRAMARMFHTYFANFAKSGNPNKEGLPTWSKYDPAKPDLMMFTSNNGSIMQADPWKDRLDLVEQAADAQHLNN